MSSLNSISERIIQNAWRLSNYDYFRNECRENETSNNTSNNENVSDDEETETETKVEMLDFSDTESIVIESVEIEVV